MRLLNISRRKLFLLLLLPLTLISSNLQYSVVDQAVEAKLYNSHIWHRLLHLHKDENSAINTQKYLLSYEDFTPKNELILTINSFYEDNQSICKYPARFEWIKNEMNLTNADFPSVKCEDFNEYLEKTNPTDLKLVFVSEQVKSPSSMMGHAFFKLEGNDKDGKPIEHAVSFFTIIDTINIPNLLLKSTITGMKGFFTLSPYKTQKQRYLIKEDRNIWEYTLNLSDYQKKLIYYHFWELKDIDIKYLLAGFNCATIVDDMLGITDKNYKENQSLWITPKDVIKRASAHKLLNSSILSPSKTWELNMLSESMSANKLNEIKNIVFNKEETKIKDFKYSNDDKTEHLEKMLIASYADYLDTNVNILSTVEANKIKNLAKIDDEKYNVDLTKYKNPLNTFDDTQVSLSYQNVDGKGGIKLGFLPATNTLYDDNREYFSESSLKTGDFSLLINKNSIRIDSFDIFSMQSLIPWNTFTENFSSEFKLNYEKHYTNNLEEYHAYNVSGGVGVTKKIHDDIFIFTLMDAGLAYGSNTFYPYFFPKVGLMIYEVYNMKSTFEYKYMFNQDNSNAGYHDFGLEQSIFINKQYRTGLTLNRKQTQSNTFNTIGASFNYYF